MRLSTVLAACAPSGSAAWQLIRSGWPDGAAASPAATMRGSSTLVSVSSVSRRPERVGAQPAARGQVGHAEAGRPDRHRAGQLATVGEHAPRPAHLGDLVGPPARSRRAAPAAWRPTGGRPRSGTAPSTPPHTSVTAGPARPARRRSRCRSARRRPRSPARRDAPRPVAARSRCGLLEFRDGIGELGCTRAPVGHRAGAADRVDQVVVVQRRRRRPASRCARRRRCASAVSTTSRTSSPSTSA